MNRNPALLKFRSIIYAYYGRHGRDLPWRKTVDPYIVLVSEIMLQQTQVDRVLPKFKLFLQTFPTIQLFAKASPAAVLRVWSGLGYNRRALHLHKAAQQIVSDFYGSVPSSYESLRRLPGIGPYTANAILAFAFNRPVLVIDTNIRRVYLHFFFREKQAVGDAELVPIMRKTLDAKNPRRWFNALMDYGAMLGREYANSNRRSKHYVKQSSFTGSTRQIRGKILKLLLFRPHTSAQMKEIIEDSRLEAILADLEREGFVERNDKEYAIRSSA
jgi:A/G-specific adenine glycosylase